MSEGKKLSDVATAAYSEGMRLLAVDASGSVKGLNLTGLVEMIAATNSVLTVRKLSKQDLDANTLNKPMTLYMPIGDMNTAFKGYKYENFPWKPDGGFMLITLPEGPSYKKQIFIGYGSANIYIRFTVYDATTKTSAWRDWKRFKPEDVS